MIIRAALPGYVVDVRVAPGQDVEEDETLMLLEGTDATHTPFYVSAPESGKIKHILLEEGDFAEEDDDLVEMADSD